MPLDEVFVGDPHSAAHNEERTFINDVLAKLDRIDRAVADSELSADQANAILDATSAVRDSTIAAATSAAGSAESAAASANLATLISQIEDSDDVVNAILNDPDGASAATLSATYARGVSVTAFGTVGDGVANDRLAVQAALDSLPVGGGKVFFPNPASFYAIDGALNVPSGAVLEGESSTKTIIREVGASPLFNLTELRREWVFRNLSIESVGGHMFELGATGGMALCLFESCRFIDYLGSCSVVHQDGGGDFIGVKYRNCDFIRFGDATVHGFDIRNTTGAVNGNNWEECRVTSNGAVETRYWRIRADAVGTYCDQNRWKSIVGQLNPAGLIEIDSPLVVTFEDIFDYDVPGAYTGSLIKVGKAAGGFPGSVKASGVGNRGGSMNGSTVFQLEIAASTTGPAIIDRVSDSLGASIVKFAPGYGATEMSASGASAVLTTSTISKVLDHTAEGMVVFNGNDLTATLPDPANVRPGRVFTLKNINATALTVNSGVTIDGVETKTLTQWQSGRYTTDGSNYFTV